MKETIVTRFAPSPTGFMHVGGVRTALFAYLFARQHGGTFILRIEDTDKEREVDGSIEHIMKSLRYILAGDITLESADPWDFGPNKQGTFGSCIQSERLDLYNNYAQKLFDAGFAYVDTNTKEELDALRQQAVDEKRPFLFREHRPSEQQTVWDRTKPLRFKISTLERTIWHDVVRGELQAGEEALDDFIIIKSDGYPTYNFCHIIDDIEMGVTHVMRGEEFISSTPKFIALYSTLQDIFPEKNITLPTFVTLPPILGESGTKKLSKRDGAKDVLEYHKEGFLPIGLANYLALQGWNPGTEQEIFSYDELMNVFSLEKIQKSGARWNEDKLAWVNKEHMKGVSLKDAFTQIKHILQTVSNDLLEYTDERLLRAVPDIMSRISYFDEVRVHLESGEYVYYFKAPSCVPETLHFKKDLNPSSTIRRLQLVHSLLANVDELTIQNIELMKGLFVDILAEEGKGEVLWPLRMALSGRDRSSDPFTIMSVIGKEHTLSRIDTAIKLLENHANV